MYSVFSFLYELVLPPTLTCWELIPTLRFVPKCITSFASRLLIHPKDVLRLGLASKNDHEGKYFALNTL